jgi:hypothetical protein
MTQVDILGTGAGATITGKITKGRYDGLLFSKQDTRSTTFPDNFIVVDVKELNGDHVTAYHAVSRFKEETFSPGSFTGDHYLVLENKPLFGVILPFDDLKFQ